MSLNGTKKRIYFAFSGGIGTFIRLTPIMEILRALGHTVAYSAIDDVTKKMDALGYLRLELPWVAGQNHSLLPAKTTKWFDGGEYWASLGYKDPVWVRRLWDTYLKTVAPFCPDLIVGDFGIEAKVTAKRLGVPFVGVTQGCYHPCVKGGRLRFWESITDDGRANVTSEVNQVLSDLGLEPISRFEEMFVGDITIIPGFPEFDELVDCPKTTHYVGPILWEGADSRDAVDRFPSNPQRTIFVYTGRIMDFVGMSGQFLLETCLEHLRELDFTILFSCGGVLGPHGGGEDLESFIPRTGLPSNCKIVEWEPVRTVYTNSAVVIHHGGHGSCMGTFKYGTPSIAIPTHSEREFNARSLERLGAGKMILPGDLNRRSLEDAVTELVSGASFRETAASWAARLSRGSYFGAVQAADLMKEML